MIYIPKQSIEFFKSNVGELLSSGRITEGPYTMQFEEQVAQSVGTHYGIATSSNGTGLFALLQYYKSIGKDTVIVQNNTMYGVIQVCRTAGFSVVYTESSSCHLSMTFNGLEKAFDGVKHQSGGLARAVVLLSHIGGHLNFEIDKISNFVIQHGVPLIEDCAHAHFATADGKRGGTFGDAGVYSYYATKTIPCGESGCIVTNNLQILEYVKSFRLYDRYGIGAGNPIPTGMNIRISEIQALLNVAVMNFSYIILEYKRATAAILDAQYENRLKFPIGFTSGYYKYIVFGEVPDVVPTSGKVYNYSCSDLDRIRFPESVRYLDVDKNWFNHSCLAQINYVDEE